jgi:hypothetical protein
MEQEKKNQIQIEIDDNTAQGVYVNLAMIGHSENEFIVDLIFIQPQGQKAKVRSRVIMSTGHAKRFLTALSDNIAKYEAQFGEIKVNPQPQDNKVGFFN